METCRIRSFRLRILRNQVANHLCGKFDLSRKLPHVIGLFTFYQSGRFWHKKTDTKHPVNTKCNISLFQPQFSKLLLRCHAYHNRSTDVITPSLVFFRICFVAVRRFVPIPKSLLQSSSRKQWMYHNTLVSLVHSGLSSCLVLYW